MVAIVMTLLGCFAARVPFSRPDLGTLILLDDPRSIEEKGRHAGGNGVDGVLVWELSNDTADHALLRATVSGLDG